MANFVKRQDQPLFHLASKILMQKIVHMTISSIIIISIFTIVPQYAQSSNGNTHVILFTKDYSREFTAGQIVHLEGQIIQAQSSSPTGIANAYYQIIDANTGNVITQGNTDSQGLLFMDWTASSSLPGTSKVNLIVRFAGGGGFDASDSPPLELTISSPVSSTPAITTPSYVYHNTQLSVQVRDGSSPGYVQVNPILRVDSGSTLTTTQVSISVDGSNVSTIASNQWSGNIFVGSGTHKIQGFVPQTRDSNNNSVIYKSTNYVTDYTISSQTSTLNNNPPPNNSPSIPSQSSQPPSFTNNPPPSQDFTVVAIVVIAAIIAGTGIGIVRIKRRPRAIKSSPIMGGTPVSTNPLHTDDTQFYGCPNCGRDTSIKYGKQYCENCRMYL